MNIGWSMRPYQGEEDYWRIRAFLREVFLLNDRREKSWQVARLDYWRWHVVKNCEEIPSIEGAIFIWESSEGQIGAVLNPEGPGEAFLQVHPGVRTPALEREMIAAAEERFPITTDEGQRRLFVWAHEDDEMRREILQERGYELGKWPEYQRRRSLEEPIPEPSPAPGYAVRALGGRDELPARSWASWRVFHPDEPDDKYDGWAWYRNLQQIPLYRRGLDVVAIAPEGEVAGFCTLWYDDVTRTGYFEPVGVVPEHQRRGLGKAIMFEALRRLKARGGVLATVAGYSEAANALYASVMSPDYRLLQRWVKIW